MTGDPERNGDAVPFDVWEKASLWGEGVSIAEALVVAPTRGRLRRGAIDVGALVTPGTLLGRVDASDGRPSHALASPANGVFLGWLAWEEENVEPGALVARIGRNGSSEAPLGTAPHPPQSPATPSKLIGSGEVHIWRSFLRPEVDPYRGLRPLVADFEWVHAAGMSPDRAYGFIASRAALRLVLAWYVPGSTPSGLEFDSDAGGKPRFVDDPSMRFSVSHSGGLTAVAVTRAVDVGVDIELVRSVTRWEGVAKRLMGPRVAALLRSLPSGSRQREFFLRWTRMEAALKVSGNGLTNASADSVRSAMADVWIKELDAPPGWTGAVSAAEPLRVTEVALAGLTTPQQGKAVW